MVRATRSIRSILVVAAAMAVAAPAGAQSPSPVPPASPAPASAPVLVCPAAGDPTAPVASASFPAEPVIAAPAAAPVGAWPGTWERIARAPIAPRSDAAADLTAYGEQLLVFSGRDAQGRLFWDGAAYDIRHDRWTKLPKVPLRPRTGFAFATGGFGSMFLWGGVAEDGTPMADGAYVWSKHDRRGFGVGVVTVVPKAPLTPGPAAAAGDLFNDLYLVTRGTKASDPPRFAFLAGPKKGWRGPTIAPPHGELPIDPPPVPAGISYEITPGPILISEQADGSAIQSSWFVLDGWKAPTTIPLAAAGGTCPSFDGGSLAWVREVTSGTIGLLSWPWASTAQPPAPASAAGMLVQSPSRVILADALVAWDTTSRTWTQLPPLPDGPRTGEAAAWAFGHLVIWGGRAADGSLPATGWRFTPTLPAGTFALPGGGRHHGACGGVGIDDGIRLRADRKDPDLVWFQGQDGRYATTWPDGWTVRFGSPTVILDEHGTVVAQVGQRLRDIPREPFCTYDHAISF
ncbi:MAG: hypothetical protein U0869_23250 [Chloroflexota bacterium]